VRITVDLQPVVYTGLHRWLGEASEVGQPKLTLSDVVRVLVVKLLEDPELGADVIHAVPCSRGSLGQSIGRTDGHLAVLPLRLL
jgi:hypothetical protein